MFANMVALNDVSVGEKVPLPSELTTSGCDRCHFRFSLEIFQVFFSLWIYPLDPETASIKLQISHKLKKKYFF